MFRPVPIALHPASDGMGQPTEDRGSAHGAEEGSGLGKDEAGHGNLTTLCVYNKLYMREVNREFVKTA
jgi:hypothetical protein